MKLITILILTLTTLCSYAQKNTAHREFPNVQFGVNISPDICYRMLKSDNDNNMTNYILSTNNEHESIKFGFTAGLNICFNLKNFVGLETGIQYSNKGYTSEFQDIVFYGSDLLAPDKIKYIYIYNFIDIPLKVNFTFGKKKVRFFTSVGATNNILFSAPQRSIYYYPDKTTKKKEPSDLDYIRYTISPTISVGIDYKINNQMNFRIEPTFRFGVLSIINAPIKGYLYNVGLNISYYFGT